MKKIMSFILILLVVFILVGCATINKNLGEISSTKSNDIPSDFAIYYSDWIVNKNIFDTYEGYIQKDLIENGVAQADYNIPDNVLKSIYDKIIELNIRSIDKTMTSANLTTSDQILVVNPCTYYEIRFTINGEIYLITGDCTAHSYKDDEKAKSFSDFVNFMREIMVSTEEYKSLPQEQGGYD